MIALPLILLLVGTIEISRYTWTRLALQDAASEGARCLGLGLPTCFAGGSMDQGGTKEFVRKTAAGWGVTIAEDEVSPELDEECDGVDDFAKVVIEHEFTSVLPALPDTVIEVEACFPNSPSD